MRSWHHCSITAPHACKKALLTPVRRVLDLGRAGFAQATRWPAHRLPHAPPHPPMGRAVARPFFRCDASMPRARPLERPALQGGGERAMPWDFDFGGIVPPAKNRKTKLLPMHENTLLKTILVGFRHMGPRNRPLEPSLWAQRRPRVEFFKGKNGVHWRPMTSLSLKPWTSTQ